jgi:hypothetical protein
MLILLSWLLERQYPADGWVWGLGDLVVTVALTVLFLGFLERRRKQRQTPVHDMQRRGILVGAVRRRTN